MRSLGSQGDARAAAPLGEALARTKASPAERVEAIHALLALSALDEERVAGVTASLREDSSAEVAVAAAAYLARAPRRLAVPALLDLLEHADAQARARAHGALLAITGDSVEPGVDQGWDPAPGARSERAEVVRRWRAWWRAHSER
ncbi:hypothetical protein HY251_11010 [bacterium]|nr:hypothetical protein [bacterium]